MEKKRKLIHKIITFIGSFFAALSVVAQFFPSVFALDGIPHLHLIVLVFVIVTMLGLFFVNWKQNQDENDYKLQIEHDATHRYAHLLRDTTYEIDKLVDLQHSNDSLSNHILTTFTSKSVSCLEDTLYALLGGDKGKNEIMVSVRTLDMQYWDNSALTSSERENVTYRTLVRSITPRGALQADDAVSHAISECLPFRRIFVDGKHDWTGNYLNQDKRIEIISEDEVTPGISYSDSCSSWAEYYCSKVVVPIRVKLSSIDDAYANSDERNLFGFVCVECKNQKLIRANDKFDKDLISILDLLKTYADTMYFIFDKIYQTTSFCTK